MSDFSFSSRSNKPSGVLGKSFTTLFFLFFLGLGSLFVCLIAREAAGGLKTWTWKKTNCEILASHVDESARGKRSSGDFSFGVQYRYTFGDQTFISDRYKRKLDSFSDYSKAARLTERFPPGSTTVCYVNPSAPAEAILQHDNPLFVLAILFPMIFVTIGAGGIYLTWKSKPPTQEASQSISDRAISPRKLWPLLLFFAFFLIIGCGVFSVLFVIPLYRVNAAREWTAVPCIVLASEVKVHSGDKGSTYSVNILYRYVINGQEFKANRYSFITGSSSGYGRKQAIVNRNPPGTKTTCYVNPLEPTDAVLERGFISEMWFGLFPLIFVAVGAGGLIVVFRRGNKTGLPDGTFNGSGALKKNATSSGIPTGPAGTLVLKPKLSAWAKFFGMLAVMLFWNGIVSVFVYQAVQSWRSHRPDWLLTLFMTPFVLIGLGMIIGVFYYLLAIFNPRARLTITPGAVPLGGTLRVQWQFSSGIGSLQNLHVHLKGREETKYRRGTNTATDTSVFTDVEIASVTNPMDIRSGVRTVTIPDCLMHSFSAPNNKIIWSIYVEGKIKRWPDLDEEFPLTVLPVVPTATKKS